MSLTAAQLFPIGTAVKAKDSFPAITSQLKQGTPFLTTTETLASITIVFSYMKVALVSTSDGSGSFVLGIEFTGNAAGTPSASPFATSHTHGVPLQGHGSKPRSHTSVRGKLLKQAEFPIHLFPLRS